MHIAVIGAGISGLSAAYWLQLDHRVTVFEANDYSGGHTNTVAVELEGNRYHIDTGFIVYNERTYPKFSLLLDELGVPSQPTEMSFSVRDDCGGLEYNGHSLNSLFAQRRNLLRPHFWRMLLDIMRFNRHAIRLAAQSGAELTVGDFLKQHQFSRAFADQYLLPMGSAIWSCPTGKFSQFPIRFIVEFYANHGLLQLRDRPTWRVIAGGSQSYVREMVRKLRQPVQLRSIVSSVRRFSDRVDVDVRGRSVQSFDHVVFACHSDQALRILGDDATVTERDVLAEFPYERNTAILHTDESVLPRNRRAWASWNYRTAGSDTPACVTYNMNILQGIEARQTFCVTLNDETHIAPERVLRRFEYSHPVYTARRSAAQARHRELLATNRTSFCGAYWGNGFHEDGVTSARAVVLALQENDRRQPSESRFDCDAKPSTTAVAGAIAS